MRLLHSKSLGPRGRDIGRWKNPVAFFEASATAIYSSGNPSTSACHCIGTASYLTLPATLVALGATVTPADNKHMGALVALFTLLRWLKSQVSSCAMTIRGISQDL